MSWYFGCGTALVAAQKLKRQWIGIDISHTACRVMTKRLPEIDAVFKRSHKVIVALTVQEILDEQIAKKLV